MLETVRFDHSNTITGQMIAVIKKTATFESGLLRQQDNELDSGLPTTNKA